MDIILQNLLLVGPVSLALLPMSIVGLVVINLRKARARA